MPNPEHLAILKEGVERSNAWREKHPGVRPDFRKASLIWINLIGANLTRADLGGTFLDGVNLSHADLGGAFLSETIFVNTDLTDTKGLHLCDHLGPSIIDHLTLAKNPNLPIEFLRGCGLSDWEIESAKLHQKNSPPPKSPLSATAS